MCLSHQQQHAQEHWCILKAPAVDYRACGAQYKGTKILNLDWTQSLTSTCLPALRPSVPNSVWMLRTHNASLATYLPISFCFLTQFHTLESRSGLSLFRALSKLDSVLGTAMGCIWSRGCFNEGWRLPALGRRWCIWGQIKLDHIKAVWYCTCYPLHSNSQSSSCKVGIRPRFQTVVAHIHNLFVYISTSWLMLILGPVWLKQGAIVCLASGRHIMLSLLCTGSGPYNVCFQAFRRR